MSDIYMELHEAIAENSLNKCLSDYFTKRRIDRTKISSEKKKESFEEEFGMIHHATTSTYTYNNIFENIADVKKDIKSLNDVSYGNVIAFLKDSFQDEGMYKSNYVAYRSSGKSVKESYEDALKNFTSLVANLNDGIMNGNFAALSTFIEKFRFK